jgi:hypothetical protein
MALPSFGQISFGDFNLDRGVSPATQVDIIQAANLYGLPYQTNGFDPTSMNEFYGAAVAFTMYTGCGRSNTNEGVCFDASQANRTFYSNCGPFDFGIGCVVYVDLYPNALIGYDYVQIHGATWTINNSTGVITGFADFQC